MGPPTPSPPPLLSSEQSRSYGQLAVSIAQHTMGKYASFLGSNRSVNAGEWKLVKTRHKVSIYRSRHGNVSDDLSDAGVRAPLGWQPQAKLLCVGPIEGTLDDAMYGSITPTESSMATRSLYIGDEFVSHRVLQDLELPTSAEPFHYLGLKWAARSPSLAALVRPRDSVYLEASGVFLTPDSHERIGYVIYESVDSSEIERVVGSSNRMVRARISGCYLLRQAAPNVVELYGTMLSNSGGHVPPKLAALSGAAVMISVSNIVDCALKKKLAWKLKTHTAQSDSHEHDPKAQHEKLCCVCSRGFSSFSSVVDCQICCTPVCSRCVMVRSLAVQAPDGQLQKVPTPMCTSCVASASCEINSADLAAREYAHEEREAVLAKPTLPHINRSLALPSSTSSMRGTQDCFDSYCYNSSAQSSLAPTERRLPSRPSRVQNLETLDEEVNEEVSMKTSPTTPDPKLALWMRMNALRMRAEHTFLVVSEQAQVQSHLHCRVQELSRSDPD